MDIKLEFKRHNMQEWTGFNWFRMGLDGERLWAW